MNFFEKVINHKINTITADELLKYANQFQIQITKEQAKKIAGFLKGREINIFNSQERIRVIKEIANIAGPDVAREVNRLFLQFIK